MKKSTIASLIGLAFASPSFAVEQINLDDVVITASRIEEPLNATLHDVSVINREQIDRAGQSSLIEILQMQPGIEITSNGGAGKTSGIFMRGTNANHVLVLIDGVRLSSATAGTTTFENLPIALIDKIEILRGPAASLYGQDAIGGVIQIFTKKGSGEPQFYAGLGYGSYDTKTAEAGIHGAINDTSFALGISSLKTDGFSALRTNNPNLNDNDGYRNLSFTGSITHQIIEGHEISFQFLNSEGHANFDSGSNLLFAANPKFYDNTDISQLSYAVTSKNRWLPNWLSTLRLAEGVDESVTIQDFGRNLYRTKQHQLSWQNDISLPVGTLTLAYDRLEERIHSTTDFIQNSRSNDGYYTGYLASLGNHSVQLNYRSDHSTRFGTNDTGGIAYGYQFNDSWRATASYGNAFKAPTFNDLYFPDFFGFPTSNPNLKPEKSDNIEASLRYQNAGKNASVTFFENRIRNLIALDSITFVPFNVNKAKIQGVMLAASQAWDNWNLQGSIDIQSPRNVENDNLLRRRANQHASANLGYAFGDWRFGAETITSSKRYEDEANKVAISGYTIFNLTSEYKINQDWKVQARLNNVLDKNYALAYDGDPKNGGFIYDTPGSNLFVNLRWEPK
jgi:vitamin B12 transporter